MGLIRIIARLLVAAIFISSGWEAVREPGGRPKAAEKLGIPQPELAVRVNAAMMIVAGAALALGLFPRVAAGVLAALLVPTTLAGHPFWEEEDAQKRNGQRIHFMKNLSMMGGLLFVVATGKRD